MPKPLDDEKVEEILDSYDDLRDYEEVAEDVDVVESTVRKYVDRAKEDGDPRVTSEEERRETSDWTGGGPSVSPFDDTRTDDDIEDYAGMSPGDFLHDFFEDFEVGVKKQWVEIQARRADRRGVLPDKETLKNDVLNMKSGIAQSGNQEATYIAEEYWAEALDYIRQVGREVDPRAANQQYQPQPGGYGGGHQPQPQPQPGFQHQPGGVGPGAGAQQQPPMFQMLLEEMREMRRELSEAKQRDPREEEKQSRLERLKELQEEKEILEELSGDSEEVQQLQARIQQLQTQIAQGGANAPAPTRDANASLEDKLLDIAASRDDVSVNDILQVIEKRGGAETDPEVIKVQKEAEIKEKELEHETRRYERLGSVFEDALAKAGEGIGRGLVEGGEAEENGTEEPTTAEEPEPAEADVEVTTEAEPEPDPEPCPHCGEPTQSVPGGTVCLDCEWAVTQCDLCSSPIEIPPKGESDYGACPDCETVLARPDDAEKEIGCSSCDWRGPVAALKDEYLLCGACDNFRPITRIPEGEREQIAAMGD